MVILAQVLALFAILFWVISILLKNKKNILLMQVIANGIYGIEYLLLGAFSAASMNFLSFLRLLVYYFYVPQEANYKYLSFQDNHELKSYPP